MDCDEDGDGDEDDDIKMGDAVKEDKKGKATKQNTLSKYFKPSPTKEQKQGIEKKAEAVPKVAADTKVQSGNEPKSAEPAKKKKRRVVMCELVE